MPMIRRERRFWESFSRRRTRYDRSFSLGGFRPTTRFTRLADGAPKSTAARGGCATDIQAPLLVDAWTLFYRLMLAWEGEGRDLSKGALPTVLSAAGVPTNIGGSIPTQTSGTGMSGSAGVSSDGPRPNGGGGQNEEGLQPNPPVELDGENWLSMAARFGLLAHDKLGAAKRCLSDGGMT